MTIYFPPNFSIAFLYLSLSSLNANIPYDIKDSNPHDIWRAWKNRILDHEPGKNKKKKETKDGKIKPITSKVK